MQPATIMIVRPRKDNDPTVYTFEWGGKAVEIAKNMGYKVVDIQKDDVTYDNVTNKIKKYRPKLFVGFSHGCPNSLQSNRGCYLTRKFGTDEILCMIESGDIDKIEVVRKMLNPLGELSCPGICKLELDPCSPFCDNPTNINELKGSIIDAVACYSASQLGKCADRFGISSYIGEADLLMFPVDSLNSQDMFGEVQVTFIRELLLGHTVEEAEAAMSKLEDAYIRKYKKIKYLSLCFLWNKLNRRILGNRNAMIYE